MEMCCSKCRGRINLNTLVILYPHAITRSVIKQQVFKLPKMSNDFEIDMTIPSASDIDVQEEQEEQVQEEPELLTLEMMVEHLPNLDVGELIELTEKVNTILKKKWKSQMGSKSKGKGKSQVEKPKKLASKALRRTQAWIPYVQKHALENGWDSFVIRQESKNKETGEVEAEEIEKSASVPNDPEDDKPAYTFKDAKTGDIITPAHVFEDTGKHLIYKEAMSLSAKLKWREGVKPSHKFKDEEEEHSHWSDLFQAFVKQYEDQEASSSSSSSSPSSPSSPSSVASSPASSPKVRRLTSAEKEAEKEEKRQIVEEEKERKRQEKEEEKERKRLEKEEEKRQKEEEREQKRLEKEEEKRRKEEEKEAEKNRKEAEKSSKKSPPAAAVKKSPVPAAKASVTKIVPAAKASVTKVVPTKPPTGMVIEEVSDDEKEVTPSVSSKSAVVTSKAITPAKTAAPKALAKSKSEPEKMVWNIPEDDLVHTWTFQGKTYLVNHLKCVWEKLPSGEAGNWVGMVIPEENRIDTEVEEPEYDE